MKFIGLNLQEQVLKNKCDIEELKQGGGVSGVGSVNGKTGVVTLDATDIKLTTNKQTVQANLIRIDGEVEAVQDIVDSLTDDVANMIPYYNSSYAGKILGVDDNGHLAWMTPSAPPTPPTGYTVTISASNVYQTNPQEDTVCNKIAFLDADGNVLRNFDLIPTYDEDTERWIGDSIPLTTITNVSQIYLYALADSEEVHCKLTTDSGLLEKVLPAHSDETSTTFVIHGNMTISGLDFLT